MQGAAKFTSTCTIVTFILSFCLGCATPSPPADQWTTVETAGQQAAAVPSKLPSRDSATAAPGETATNRLLDINISEQPNEIVITLFGTGPLKNYQMQRLGENQFVLDLGDVQRTPPQPPVPTASDKVRLIYRDSASSRGIQIVGTLNRPFERYFLSPTDSNGLMLRLTLVDKSSPRAVPVTRSVSPSPSSSMSVGPEARPVVAPGRVTGPAPVRGSSVGSGQETGLNKSFVGKPISLDLLDADVKNVLRLIADITGTNMVIDPGVAGQVTLKVEQVPWDQVLDLILSMNDLAVDKVGNVIRIATRAKLQQEWKQQEETLKARQQLMEASKDFGEITTEYLAVNYAKPADIAAKISEIKSEKGKISIDDRTSLVIYTDYQSRLQNAKTLISRLDKPTPQVMIEARIVQLNKNMERDLGIEWNFFLASTSGSGSHLFTQDFQVNHPATSPDSFGFSFGQLTGQTIWNVDLILTALETRGEGKIVSAPRVLTMDNVKALIKQGKQVPYLVLSDQNVASTELVDAVLELEVTPHITPDERVRLEIKAKKDQVDLSAPIGIQSQPPIDTKEIQTELLVDDGAVIVIGGIIENSEDRSEEGVPGLNRVPLLGWLFRSNFHKITKTELLIFISPKIVGYNVPPVQG